MNDFLADLAADSPLLWALFVLGVVASAALALRLVSNLVIKLGSALGPPLGRRGARRNGTSDGEPMDRDDVVS